MGYNYYGYLCYGKSHFKLKTMKSFIKEIVVEPEIKWDMVSLVVNGENVVVLTDGWHRDQHFGGVEVHGPFIGEYVANWSKSKFKPFQGEITLKS